MSNTVFNKKMLNKLIIEKFVFSYRTEKNRTSIKGFDTYLATVNNREELAQIRKFMVEVNKKMRLAGLKGYKVEAKGRLGKNNPAAGYYYKKWNGPDRILLEDASRIDVYLYEKF